LSLIPPPLAVISVGLATEPNSNSISSTEVTVELIVVVVPFTVRLPVITVFALLIVSVPLDAPIEIVVPAAKSVGDVDVAKKEVAPDVASIDVKPAIVVLEAPSDIEVEPIVTALFVSDPLPIFVSVFVEPLIDLLVNVSVVALPTKVSVAAGRVKVVVPAVAVANNVVVPEVEPLNAAPVSPIVGRVRVLFVRVCERDNVTISTPSIVTTPAAERAIVVSVACPNSMLPTPSAVEVEAVMPLTGRPVALVSVRELGVPPAPPE